MPQFAKTNSENLVRNTGSGVYYLSAKVAGKKIRFSLGTKSLRAAQMKRDDELQRLRYSGVQAGDCKNLGEALDLCLVRYAANATTKESTRAYYVFAGKSLRRLLPVAAKSWNADEQRSWWKTTIEGRSAAWVNNTQVIVRAVIETARAAGLRVDPCAVKRVPMRRKRESVLPSQADFARILENVLAQKKAHSQEAVDLMEWLACSGMRIGELQALRWEDVGDEWLTIRGGKEGTKSKKVRRLPISGPLAAVIARRRYVGACGPVFEMKSPHEALRNACLRLQIAHIRVHDLRHLFATRAIEAGVDIPTVAKWLGHSDGGALAMKTYGHLRDDHSLKSAALL
jgi:integrase